MTIHLDGITQALCLLAIIIALGIGVIGVWVAVAIFHGVD